MAAITTKKKMSRLFDVGSIKYWFKKVTESISDTNKNIMTMMCLLQQLLFIFFIKTLQL